MAEISSQILRPQDVLSGSQAMLTVKIGDNQYKMGEMTEFEAKYEFTKKEVPILGRSTAGNKITGGKGTFSGKMYYVSSVFRKWLSDYISSGVMVPFTIIVENEDKSSAAGKQQITYKDCLLDSVILSKFATGDNLLDEDVNGTFSDFTIDQHFDFVSWDGSDATAGRRTGN